MSCGVAHRHNLDPVLLWRLCRSAAAALIHLLAQELPYGVCMALKEKKKLIITNQSVNEGIKTILIFPWLLFLRQFHLGPEELFLRLSNPIIF